MLDEHPSLERLTGTTFGGFRLEQIISRSQLGALYQAQRLADSAPHLLRVITLPRSIYANQPPYADQSSYLARFRREAALLTTLQHPYILPLVEYGVARDLPYLVWPAVSTRTLAARLTHNGPVDPLTAGRYLDQIAAALEYAHERSILHRNLSAACVYLQLDGRLLVAEFGVRRLIELARPDAEQYALNALDEACAPEQIREGALGPATDVYGLGALLYQALSGAHVFPGATREEVAQRHLMAPVPSLSAIRSGLPVALDDVLARALAKEPGRRFQQPGALANAYHQIVAPNATTRIPFVVGASGSAQQPLTQNPYSPLPGPHSLAPHPLDTDEDEDDAQAGVGYHPGAETPRSPQRTPAAFLANRPWAVLLAAVVILALVGAGVLIHFASQPAGVSPAIATVTFSDSPASQTAATGGSDALRLVAQHLPTPSAGFHYAAWLINSQTENIVSLGSLTPQNGQPGVYSLALIGQNGQPGQNLLGLGDRIEVTQEQGQTSGPTGRIVLLGVFPPLAFVHVRHLLVSFPTTPGAVGLMVGARDQALLLHTQAQQFAAALAAGQNATAQCLAQSLLDIAEGSSGAEYKPLSAACQALNVTAQGDGFGLLPHAPSAHATGNGYGSGYSSSAESGFLQEAAAHASLAAAQTDATAAIRTAAGQVEVCLSNMQGWITSLAQAASAYLLHPNASAGQAILSLARKAYQGTDTNLDGRVDPVAGEGGALTAYFAAQRMATLTLKATSN